MHVCPRMETTQSGLLFLAWNALGKPRETKTWASVPLGDLHFLHTGSKSTDHRPPGLPGLGGCLGGGQGAALEPASH